MPIVDSVLPNALHADASRHPPALCSPVCHVLLLPTGEEGKPAQARLDLRLGRRFSLGRGLSVEPLLEVYDALDETASVTEVDQVGAALGRMSRNLDAASCGSA